jgi:hypothetical protein
VRAALELGPGRRRRRMLPACSASAGALQSLHARRWPRGRRCPLAAASRWAMAAERLHRRGVALVGRRCLPTGFPRVCEWGIGVDSEGGETERRERQAAGEIELETTRDDVGAEWAVDSWDTACCDGPTAHGFTRCRTLSKCHGLEFFIL